MPMPTSSSNESRFDNDARNLIEASVKQQDLSKFQTEIQSMSNQDRLDFFQALNRQASEFTYQSISGQNNGMGGMKRPFVDVEKVTNKSTGDLVDIDILITDNEDYSKVAARTDLFDPKDGTGKEIDELQQATRDAGAYVRMDHIFRFDESEEITGYHPSKEKSGMTDTIYNRMSAEIKDPERHKKASEHFKNPDAQHQKYETESRMHLSEYNLQQLPQDFQDMLRLPAKRVDERFRQFQNRYKSNGYPRPAFY